MFSFKLHNVIFNYPFWRRCPSRTRSIFPRLEQGPCSVERYILSTSSITDHYFHIHTLCKWNLLGSKFLQFDRISLWPGHNIGLCPLVSIIKKNMTVFNGYKVLTKHQATLALTRCGDSHFNKMWGQNAARNRLSVCVLFWIIISVNEKTTQSLNDWRRVQFSCNMGANL